MCENNNVQYVCNFHFEGKEDKTVFPIFWIWLLPENNLKTITFKKHIVSIYDNSQGYLGVFKIENEPYRSVEIILGELASRVLADQQGFCNKEKAETLKKATLVLDRIFKEFKETFPDKKIKVKTIPSHSGNFPKRNFEIISV